MSLLKFEIVTILFLKTSKKIKRKKYI